MTYDNLVEAIERIIIENDGNDPDNGVTLIGSADMYAAYAWLNSLDVDKFSEWRSDAEEEYEGEFESDEEFAQNMAENMGSLPADGAPWPLSYIDWERATRDLMFDYSAHAGFYFRNL